MESHSIRPDTAAKPAQGAGAKAASPAGHGLAATLAGAAASFVELVRSAGMALDPGSLLQQPLDRAARTEPPPERRPQEAAERPRAPARQEDRSQSARGERTDRPRERTEPAHDDTAAKPRAETAPPSRPSDDTVSAASAEGADPSAGHTGNGQRPADARASDAQDAATPATGGSDIHPDAAAGTAALENDPLAALARVPQTAVLAAGDTADGDGANVPSGPVQPQRPADLAPGATPAEQGLERARAAAAQASPDAFKGTLHAPGLARTDTADGQTRATGNGSAAAEANLFVHERGPDAARTATQQQQQAGLAALAGEGQKVQVRMSGADATLPAATGARAAAAAAVAAEAMPDQAQQPATAPGLSIAAQAQGAQAARAEGQANAAGRLVEAQAAQQASQAAAKAPVDARPAAPQNGPFTLTGAGETAAGQSPGQPHAAERAQAAQRPPAAPPPARPVAEQISVHIARALESGVDRINIQLRPESLGRIEVRLELGGDGKMTALVTADNRDTLDLLQRDQRSLERAFADAGFDLDRGGINYNLREQMADGDGNGAGDGSAGEGDTAGEPASDAVPASPVQAYGGWQPGSGRLDIRA